MQRYFVAGTNEQNIVFSKEQVHHILKVMRMTVGSQFFVVLENEQTGIVAIETIANDSIVVSWLETIETQKELPVHVTIACGLPKGDKLEWIVQKSTELGASALIPVQTQFSITKWDNKKATKKIERLQKIAVEAAEQSHRTRLPIVQPLVTLHQLVQTFHHYTHIIVAYEEDAKLNERSQFKQVIRTLKQGDTVLAIFGCEGGFSKEEMQHLQQYGAISCGLGPRIMRAETAPLYALSALSYALELND